jgi:beta-glucosidase
LADILFGNVNPSGKLSVSFPHDVGTLPAYYDFLNSGRPTYPGHVGADGTLYFGSSYILDTPVPWFPFGYGLSYTTFGYGQVTLSSSKVSAKDTVTAAISITNNGTRDGAEVVQLYVKDMVASVAVPNIQLKGFEKVFIKAGETVKVKIALRVGDLGLWDRKMEHVVEKGNFTVFVGSSSADFRANATLTVV